MSNRVAVHMAVHNAHDWLPAVLDAVAVQTYPNTSVVIWDNASDDDTAAIISRYPGFKVMYGTGNIGFWAAQERMLADSDAEFILALTDVVLDPEYIANCVHALIEDPRRGAVQGKLLRKSDPDRIDALGFRLQRSRRVTILGHGEPDDGRWDHRTDIFGVEGAAPMFRRAALEDCRIDGHVIDPDYRVGPLGYGDDFDLAWRLTLLGWHQIMEPSAVGWHDRSTTVSVGHGISDHINRRSIRARIPPMTRQLDWSNVRFSILKNDYILSILRDLPMILAREAAVLGYIALFEPRTLAGCVRFARLAPTMLRRRHRIMQRARMSRNGMDHFIA
ncbi:MAG TPA: glycosyltransferase [Candidatus Paceibacterota bacterium]|nr:glycosyltransferase [Candidatus Paceibacterota bacterium]